MSSETWKAYRHEAALWLQKFGKEMWVSVQLMVAVPGGWAVVMLYTVLVLAVREAWRVL